MLSEAKPIKFLFFVNIIFWTIFIRIKQNYNSAKLRHKVDITASCIWTANEKTSTNHDIKFHTYGYT